ncbi:unnamed protein product [Leptidea sinapis]|uniref:Peptidase M1 leukotriene A4 hydrolase/aminopeptidase C-terminal domain-containing protein n=1 Tax=Leptidea sinapis TaxID=189913 RepID=A0A5E4QH17_9NEOP|nr:unnamed protein product [Leptidea sinapis]
MAVIGKLFSRDNFRLSAVKHNIVKYSNTGIISIVNKRNGDNNYIKEIRAKNNWQSFTKRKLYTYNRNIEAMALSPLDPSSYSRPELAVVKHVELSLDVDFENKQLSGLALLTVNAIEDINEVKLRIKYKTSPSATALQWLEPKQTSGKKYPYMFSQCQPIHARSIMPCQDSPAVKFTYTAEVSAPENFSVLMSAIRDGSNNTKTTFRQPVPIPSYLLAIAVGVLESRELGPRSHVWAEKEEIERSAWEFADTEKYLQAAEALCGPYQWTQYDLLVLPPSFPYGGMENPCLTFAGDRSQADVIVHEIMHSWTGNLVTNRNFEHFWLNEGFTVFLERKVGASLISDKDEARKSRDFNSLLGLQELTETIKDDLGVENPLTQLVVNLSNVHPDDAFSTVPYEKGSLFLRVLEDSLGGPDTDQFKSFLFEYFKDSADQTKALNDVDWATWLHKPGMPPVIPEYDTSMTKAVKNVLLKINLNDTASLDYNDVISFSPHQMINLLQHLVDQDALPLDKLRTLGEAYRVSTSKNTEIAYRWLRICIRSRDENKLNDSFAFVNQQGRMKYVRPIYRDLYAWEDVRERTIENFLRNEPYMMHVSAYTIRKDLHIDV